MTNNSDVNIAAGRSFIYPSGSNQFFNQEAGATLDIGTTAGDVNLDGIFNSTDLIQVFQAGEYEDGIAANSTWAEGDWNCDQEFNTTDLIGAFQSGAYVEVAQISDGDLTQVFLSQPSASIDPPSQTGLQVRDRYGKV